MNLDLRPPVTPLRLAWTALAAYLAASVLATVVIRLNPAVGLWFNQVFCILGVVWAVTRASGRAPLAYVKLSWPGLPAVLFASALSVANYMGLAGPINAISEHFAPDSLKDALDLTRILGQLAPWQLWLVAAAAVLAAPVCEEFVFRGVIQQGLTAGSPRPVEGILLGGLVFSLSHLNPVSFFALLELGVFFGLLYHRTGSLLPGMVAHATQNAATFAIYFLAGGQQGNVPDASEEMSPSKLAAFAGMGLVVLAMLFLLGRHFPSVWGRPKETPSERPRMSLLRALAPWLVAASVFLLGWYAVDRRGIEVELADWQVDVPVARADESAGVRAERAELETLRNSVRAGKASLHTYVQRRRAMAASLGQRRPSAAPDQPH